MRVAALALTTLCTIACAANAGDPRPPAPDEMSIGYGTRAESESAGAVASVTDEETDGFHYTRVEEMIAGRVPGVMVRQKPNGDYSIRIRGINSFRGSNEPLIVIDGVPSSHFSASSALSAVNPRDVRRIDVLKDAASTSIYGSRGANGVILITTKTGRP